MASVTEEFVSAPITPAPGAFDAAAMSRGEPGLPHSFTWHGQTYTIAETRRTWRTSTPDRGELYLRRHWFSILTTTGETMTLYCERQTKLAKNPKQRWYLYSLARPAGESTA